MWLIHTTSLTLVEFHGDPHEDYAILSHTWGKDEVTFADFRAHGAAATFQKSSMIARDNASRDRVLATSGYAKIRGAASLSRQHGLQYLWVDTCCIDKTSSAELSESINSMYRWYGSARFCFAYLSDVEYAEIDQLSAVESNFRRSRWFTRGWTLQELVAPKIVKFYSKDWSYLMAKEPVIDSEAPCQLLAEITGISRHVLLGTTSPGDISVANRMRWVACRETTRLEDMAYCLLGLFNVNMPLLYGEGERAFIRLQEEILKETDDQSLFLWALPAEEAIDPDALHGLLARSPKLFSNLDFDHVRPLPPSRSQESAPVSITNQGLRTNMMLVPCGSEEDTYYALLDCIVGRPQDSVKEWSPCIILQRLWGNQFARVASPNEAPASSPLPHERGASPDGSVRLIPVVDARSADFFDEDVHGAYQTVYVRQTPFEALPEVAVRQAPGRNSGRPCTMRLGYSVVDAYPPERWDAALSVVRTKDPRSGATIVALRFGSDRSAGSAERLFLDVTVGLRRLGRRWEVCYEKHPYAGPGSQVQKVYEKFPSIAADFEQMPQFRVEMLKPVAIINTETQRRGRRFIQIEVFDTFNGRATDKSDSSSLFVSPSMAMRDLSAEKEKLESLLDKNRMSFASREYCYEETFNDDIYAEPFPSSFGIRTSYSGDMYRLMKRQLDVPIPEGKPYYGLVMAMRAGDFEAVHLATEANRSIADVMIEELGNCRAIHCAASLGFLGAIEWLIQLGADVRAYTKSGLMPVHLAVLSGHFDVACELVAAVPRESYDDAPWKSFLTEGRESVLHLFAAHGFPTYSPDAQRLSRLLALDTVEAIEHKNSRGELAMHRAAANASASPDWHIFAEVRNSSLAVDNWGRSALFHAACGGNTEIIDKLIRLHDPPNSTDKHERTPLHAAVMAGHAAATRFLLDRGADPNKVAGIDGLTPLHLACLYGHEACVEELLSRPYWYSSSRSMIARVNKRAKGHVLGLCCQPIHLAVGNGRAGCVAKLLEAGCDLHGRCDSYFKLWRPSKNDLREGQLILLAAPLMALDIAMMLGHGDISSMIEERVSKWGTGRGNS